MKLYRELYVYQHYNEKYVPQNVVSLERVRTMVPEEDLIGLKIIHEMDQDYLLLDDVFDIVTRNGWWYVNTYWKTDPVMGVHTSSGYTVLTFIVDA